MVSKVADKAATSASPSAGKLQEDPTEHHFLHFLPQLRKLCLSIRSYIDCFVNGR